MDRKEERKKEKKKRANALVELNSWQTPQLHVWLIGRQQQIPSVVPLAHKHPFHQIRINLDAPKYRAASGHKNQRFIENKVTILTTTQLTLLQHRSE